MIEAAVRFPGKGPLLGQTGQDLLQAGPEVGYPDCPRREGEERTWCAARDSRRDRDRGVTEAGDTAMSSTFGSRVDGR